MDPRTGRLPSKLFLYATAAIAGAAVLVVELVGTRLLAPWLGQSHYVWTAQISVTLAALATGYALGGRWSRKGRGIGTLYLALAAGGVVLCASVMVSGWVAERTATAHLALSTLITSTTLFFAPLALLATMSPLLAGELSHAGAESAAAGSLLGRVLAVNTAGSIVGALVAGLMLIPHVSSAAALYGTALLFVALSAAYVLLYARRDIFMRGAGASLFLVTAAWMIRPEPGNLVPPFSQELERTPSAYGLLQVLRERPGPRLFLMSDNLIQAAWDTNERKSSAVFADLVLAVLRGYAPKLERVLCVGLGAGVIPMELAGQASRGSQGAQVEVVEINPEIARLAVRWFDYRPEAAPVRIADGRTFIHSSREQWDAVVLDAFLGDSVPAHLVTIESLQDIRAHLRPGGLLVIDAFGPPPGGNDFLVASFARTLAAVFADLRAYQVLSNIVFVASDRLVDPVRFDVSRSYRYNRGELQHGLTRPLALDPERGVLLTDRFNPLDAREAENAAIRRRMAAAALILK